MRDNKFLFIIKVNSLSSSVNSEKAELKPLIAVVMGSDSDLITLQPAIELLEGFNLTVEVRILSAHRTPLEMTNFAKESESKGLKVIIAGAGGAAHLPGMVASNSPLPVIGVPIKSSNSIDGWDSILSILQMPGGVPVATVALDGAKNGAILAVEILGSNNSKIQDKVIAYKKDLENKVKSSSLDN